MTEAEIIDRLSVWIKSFSWEENDEQTYAEMKFAITGITDCHLDEIVDVDVINDCVLNHVVAKKAAQFADVYTIEELTWKIVGITDALGRSTEALQVRACLRLAEDSFRVVKNRNQNKVPT